MYLRLFWRPRVVNISTRNLEKYWNLSNRRSLEFPVLRFCLYFLSSPFYTLSMYFDQMCRLPPLTHVSTLVPIISTAQHMIGLWPSCLNFCWCWKNVWKNWRSESENWENLFVVCETRCDFSVFHNLLFLWNIKNFMMIVCEEFDYQWEKAEKIFQKTISSRLRKASWLWWMTNEFLISHSDQPF